MKDKTKRTEHQIKNKSVSEDLLSNYRGAVMKISEFFKAVQEREFDVDNIDENLKLVQAILMASERLGRAIETLGLLEAKVQKDEQLSNKRRGTETTALFEE